MKSLEVLKNIKYDYSICDNMVLDDKFTNVLVEESIQELEAFKNRSCENCLFLEDSWCEYNDRLGLDDKCIPIDYIHYPEEFCCNKWIAK